MALAMMVKTRLWLGGEGSEQRAMPLMRRLIERVKRCAAHRPLWVCPDGLVAYIRARRETFREPGHPGQGGRPRLRPWRLYLHRPRRQALRATTGGRDRTPPCRWHTGSRGDAQAAFAGRRRHQYGVHRATERHFPCASGLTDTPRSRAGALDSDLTAWNVS